MLFIKKIIIPFSIIFSTLPCFATSHTAPITGFAHSFLTMKPIPQATITIFETGEKTVTDDNGKFGPIQYPIGKPITLIFSKPGFVTTQSDTAIVPKEGFTQANNNFTFQVPSDYVFLLLKKTIGATEDPNSCHVTATITAAHKTLDDYVQGEKDAIVRLIPAVTEKPFYFDIFLRGPLKDRTYPFATGLTKSSPDGGVAFFNLPPRDEPYRMIAEKNGITFSEAKFICRKGIFINMSPPRGPMVQ